MSKFVLVHWIEENEYSIHLEDCVADKKMLTNPKLVGKIEYKPIGSIKRSRNSTWKKYPGCVVAVSDDLDEIRRKEDILINHIDLPDSHTADLEMSRTLSGHKRLCQSPIDTSKALETSRDTEEMIVLKEKISELQVLLNKEKQRADKLEELNLQYQERFWQGKSSRGNSSLLSLSPSSVMPADVCITPPNLQTREGIASCATLKEKKSTKDEIESIIGSQRLLILENSVESPGKLTAKLMSAMFTRNEMAASSVTGRSGKKYPKQALNAEKINLIIAFVLEKYPYEKVVIIKQRMAQKCKTERNKFKRLKECDLDYC